MCAGVEREPPSAPHLRVLMATPRYLPFVGGVEIHVDEVSRRLATRGVAVTILTTDVTGRLPAHEELDGVHVRRVPARPRTRDYYFAPGIYTEIARGGWDVVHVQSYHTLVAPLAMLAARRARIPYVVTFHAGGHSSALRRAIRPGQLALLRPLLARAERLIALAPREVDRYSERLHIPRERFVVVPNGSDLPTATALGTRARDPDLLASVGRLERYKGHHRVIAALPDLVRQRPAVRLWVAGTGPYESSLRELAATLGVSRHLELRAVPVEERGRMAQELSRVKVVVSMSEFETQPLAALEALAAGCRLVVADTPGLDDLAERGLARAIPLASAPAELAAAVLEELEGPDVLEPPKLPTWDECADALLDLYRTVAADAGAASATR